MGCASLLGASQLLPLQGANLREPCLGAAKWSAVHAGVRSCRTPAAGRRFSGARCSQPDRPGSLPAMLTASALGQGSGFREQAQSMPEL